MAFYPCKVVSGGGGGGGSTSLFNAGYYSSSSSERQFYSYTASAPCVLKVTGLFAYTNVSDDDAYVEIRKNGTPVVQVTAPTRYGSPLSLSGVNDITLTTGDVVTVVGYWNNTHNYTTWYYAVALNIE